MQMQLEVYRITRQTENIVYHGFLPKDELRATSKFARELKHSAWTSIGKRPRAGHLGFWADSDGFQCPFPGRINDQFEDLPSCQTSCFLSIPRSVSTSPPATRAFKVECEFDRQPDIEPVLAIVPLQKSVLEVGNDFKHVELSGRGGNVVMHPWDEPFAIIPGSNPQWFWVCLFTPSEPKGAVQIVPFQGVAPTKEEKKRRPPQKKRAAAKPDSKHPKEKDSTAKHPKQKKSAAKSVGQISVSSRSLSPSPFRSPSPRPLSKFQNVGDQGRGGGSRGGRYGGRPRYSRSRSMSDGGRGYEHRGPSRTKPDGRRGDAPRGRCGSMPEWGRGDEHRGHSRTQPDGRRGDAPRGRSRSMSDGRRGDEHRGRSQTKLERGRGDAPRCRSRSVSDGGRGDDPRGRSQSKPGYPYLNDRRDNHDWGASEPRGVHPHDFGGNRGYRGQLGHPSSFHVPMDGQPHLKPSSVGNHDHYGYRDQFGHPSSFHIPIDRQPHLKPSSVGNHDHYGYRDQFGHPSSFHIPIDRQDVGARGRKRSRSRSKSPHQKRLRIQGALHHVERAHLYSAQMVERMQGQALQMVERLHMQSNY